MSRRSAGFVGAWAEIQRQQQRQAEAEARRRREEARQAREHQRLAAQGHRDHCQAEAQRRTQDLEDQVAGLRSLLATGCRGPAFRASSLMRAEDVPPFDPGHLARPVPLPDPRRYQAHGGWTAGRRAQAQAEAQARFERDWHAAQAAEAQRQQQVAALQREHDRRAEARLAEVRRHNAGVAATTEGVGRGDPDAVVEYFSAVLYASTAWPQEFPRQVAAAYDAAGRQLVLDWEMPAYDVVPEAKSVRYLYREDRYREAPRPVGQRRALYREVLGQSVLLVLHQLFAADEYGSLDSVVVNGFVDAPDPATGRRTQVCLATVMASRAAFTDLRLEQVEPVSCLTDALRGQLAARPDQLTSVRPSRRPQDVGSPVAAHGGDHEPDLYTMDPVAFESLVADLFRAMGMEAVTTQRSHDGGVDVDATDPTPIRGGKIVVQVKRYRSTVPPTAVRDLYGTVQDAGANKGVLVTTSGFGPGSHTFAGASRWSSSRAVSSWTCCTGTVFADAWARAGPPRRGRRRPTPRLCRTTTTCWAWRGPAASRSTCARWSAVAAVSSAKSTSSSSTTRGHRTDRSVRCPRPSRTRRPSASPSTRCRRPPTGWCWWPPSTRR